MGHADTDEFDVIPPEMIPSLLQNPAYRIKDTAKLLMLARRAYSQNQNDFISAASCLCVIGYRALESGLPSRHPDYDFCLNAGADQIANPRATSRDTFERVKGQDSPSSFEGYCYRWFVSLHLMLGYIRLAQGELEFASEHFQHIVASHHRLDTFPNMLTNDLKACMILGVVRAMRGDDPGALAAWDEATSILKIGLIHREFFNFWSFHDLVVSGALARETFQLAFALRLELGLARQPPVRIPEGRAIDPSCLGFPGVQFLKDGRLKLPSTAP
jgi:hypothetical protein